MNDRFDDRQLGESVRDSVARNVRRVEARPDADDLFARVGVRAARQRRSLAASAVALVAVASLVGYSIGTANRDGSSTVQTPVAGPSDPTASASPPEDATAGPLNHLFTRTVNGITVRVYTTDPTGDPTVPGGFIVAEMSNDAAVGVGRAASCDGGGVTASGTFAGPEGSPVQWVVLQSLEGPSTAGVPVRATLGGVTDEMVPVRGIAVLVLPGSGPSVLVEGPGGGGLVTIGQPFECPPPPTPSTLPPAGPQPADVAAAEAGVRQAYVDVYDNYTPPIGNSNVQGDQRVQQALREAGYTDEQLAAMTVEVGEIRFTDETHAAVMFRLTIPGHMDGTQDWRVGYAAFQDGRWTQARETYCDDLRSIGVDCP